MKRFYTKVITGSFILLFPFIVGCSLIGGNSYSSDPNIRKQQEEIERLEAEHKDLKRLADEAIQREKAAKARLKAAEHELKAMKSQLEAQ
ncbi:hypothetical protein WG947_13110 [Pontibacter sp. H259]|uniref:hypothetical protein n=1 Tax=Pontibacter sp. H259 TaxID=3133421 RepID=UPI0030BE62F6